MHPIHPIFSILSLMSLFIIISLFPLSAGERTENAQTITYTSSIVCLDGTPVPASVHVPSCLSNPVLQYGTVALLIGTIFIPPCHDTNPIMIDIIHFAPFPGDPSNASQYAASIPNFPSPVVISQGTLSTVSAADSGSTVAFALAVSEYVCGRFQTLTVESVSFSLSQCLPSTVRHSVQLPHGPCPLPPVLSCTPLLPDPSDSHCILRPCVHIQNTFSAVERRPPSFVLFSFSLTTINCPSSPAHAPHCHPVKQPSSHPAVSPLRPAKVSNTSSCCLRRHRTHHMRLSLSRLSPLLIPIQRCYRPDVHVQNRPIAIS